jgi:glutamyl-Q tRNA(Asp) synthetase
VRLFSRGYEEIMIVTRFAPSPTGLLHLGHAYAALFAAHETQGSGRFLLRIEDIDRSRARSEFESAIFADLAWLGIEWETPVRRQSEHFDDYRAALKRLEADGLVYPCFCTRKSVAAEVADAAGAPHGKAAIYPGTCRRLPVGERTRRIEDGEAYALRFDAAEASRRAGALTFHDRDRGAIGVDANVMGDVVIARKDTPTSYNLSVVVDDAGQGITLVTRGDDLLDATHVQRLLQASLDLPEPAYRHHRMILNAAGERLSKRDGAKSLAALRDAGERGVSIRRQLGFNH